MTEELYGLTLSQHKSVERLDRKDRVTSRGNTQQASRDKARYRGIARIMLIDATNLMYSPLTPRNVALFEYAPNGQQIMIQMSGFALEGDLVLTIGGVEMHIECSATTEELRAALEAAGITLQDCRATAFPGCWELDFNFGRWAANAPPVSCIGFEPAEDDFETPAFSGDVKVITEAWVSSTEDADSYVMIEAVDWIPFETDALTRGAIGAALWHFQAGWLALTYQCREWSFAQPDPYGGGA